MNNWTNSIWYYQYNVSLLPRCCEQVAAHTHTRTHILAVEYTHTYTQRARQTPPKHRRSSHTPMTHMHTLSRRSLCVCIYRGTHTATQGVRTSTATGAQTRTHISTLSYTSFVSLQRVVSLCAYACLSTLSLSACVALVSRVAHQHTHTRASTVSLWIVTHRRHHCHQPFHSVHRYSNGRHITNATMRVCVCVSANRSNIKRSFVFVNLTTVNEIPTFNIHSNRINITNAYVNYTNKQHTHAHIRTLARETDTCQHVDFCIVNNRVVGEK